MTVWITGEKGFVAKSFIKHSNINVENSNESYNYWRQRVFTFQNESEIDIFDPTLKTLIERADVDCIIHTATISKGKEHDIIRNNIEGSFYISKIAQELNIPILFISYINHPNKIFNLTQDTIINIFKTLDVNYINVYTDELFGYLDTNGNISQLLLSSADKIDQAEINIDIESKHRYTYIDDFINGLNIILLNLNKYLNKDVYIMSNEEITLEDIIDYMSNDMEIDVNYNIQSNNIKDTIIKNTILDGFYEKYPFKEALFITRDLMLDE